MFDLGFTELLLVAVVALVVLGPERLPKAARFAGLWVRRARAQWNWVKGELERELAAEELKRSLQDSRDALQDLDGSLRATGDEARREFEMLRERTRDAVLPAAAHPHGTALPAHADSDADNHADVTPAPAVDDGADEPRA